MTATWTRDEQTGETIVTLTRANGRRTEVIFSTKAGAMAFLERQGIDLT